MFFSSNKSVLSEADLSQLRVHIGELLGLQNIKDLTFTQNKDKKYLIRLPFVANSIWPSVAEKAADFAQATFGQKLSFETEYNVPIYEAKQSHIKNVKNIIAVASGKGGVGKSASALNLAIALQLEGARVGILDADIYGPSIPIMLGTQNERPESPDNKIMHPIMAHGLASNSIGYLVQNDHASIWRGPMASKALTQLLKETAWPMLDYLIVDMPPGTGDIQLTMCQQLPLTAAVVVTTPQDIALSDAAKGIAMFEKLDVPVLGIIENMSYFECGNCHHKTAIFSEKGAQSLSEKYALPLLAQVPLDPIIREYADAGKSLLHEKVQHDISIIYRQCAVDLSRQLCEIAKLSAVASKLAGSIQVTQLDS